MIGETNRYNFHYNPESKNLWFICQLGLFKTTFNFKTGFSFKKYPLDKLNISELSFSIFSEGVGKNEVIWIGDQDSKLYRYLPELAINYSTTQYAALIRFISSHGERLPLNPIKIPGISIFASLLFQKKHAKLKRNVFGLEFKNPVGLAAGLDKDAIAFNQFGDLGFGFIEIGTVTPKAQPGNDQPRLFRLPENEALINRMGFNNKGVIAAANNLKKRKDKTLIIGGNIGKNKNTPIIDAVNDYIICFNELFDVVDYFVVNVSSPNTPNLRELQEKEPLQLLLNTLQTLNNKKKKPKPILLKIAPDLTNSQLDDIIDIIKKTKLAGVATQQNA